MKKIRMCLCLIVSFLIMGGVLATDVNVRINGKEIQFEDAKAQIINDRTMVPFRRIFNELGVTDDNIDWNGETKTITASNDTTQIVLQIGNETAQKKEGDKVTQITLDSAPVIRNDRTLVPLRFIAESMGKIVSWDANTRTAIIDDATLDSALNSSANSPSNNTPNTTVTNNTGDYFINAIATKSSSLSQFLSNPSSNVQVSVTRKYTDLENAKNNNTALVTATISETRNGSNITQKVDMHFSGSNDLMQDIASEGWKDIQYENQYYDTYFTTKALTDGWKKVYGQEQLKFLYTGLKCTGNPQDSIADMLKRKTGMNESQANAQILQVLSLFNATNNGGLTTGNIASTSISMSGLDLTQLDTTMWDSPINRMWTFLNSQVFHFDVVWEELRYDYPTMNMTIYPTNSELTIDFILSNTYNEKVEYIVKINK